MKKLLLMMFAFLIIATALTSCSVTSMCPSYGGTKRMTSYGHKAQARYTRQVRKSTLDPSVKY